MPPTLTRRSITIDGHQVSYLERGGPNSKPSLIVLHGLLAEADAMSRFVDYLPQDSHILIVDLPGAGYSSRPETTHDVSFNGLAHTLLELLNVLGLKEVVLIGHSHGGALSLQLATQHRNRFAGLVLLCPAHPFSGSERRLVRFYLTRAGHIFAHTFPRFPKWFLLAFIKRMPGRRSHYTPEHIAPYLHTIRSPGTIPHLLRLLNTWETDMHRLRRELRYRPLETPALLLWGVLDEMTPFWSAKGLLAHMTATKFVPLPGIGHMPTEEAPEECGNEICEWLTELESYQTHPEPTRELSLPVHRVSALGTR